MYFAEQALADFRQEVATVPAKQATLQERYLRHAFAEERAKEFAHHGFVRRLKTLGRCVENVFALIPPERVDPVDREKRIDAEINIQASLFNVFAAADNLAWIWVVEKGVRRADGTDLPETWVGLRRCNTAVRAALPIALRTTIERFDDWFDAMDNYRHSLAHRIPLYIPPYSVNRADEAAYAQLESRKNLALAQGNMADYDRARAEQRRMEFFQPLMLHSLSEGARPLVFHPQLLANFNTIEELGRSFLDELEVN